MVKFLPLCLVAFFNTSAFCQVYFTNVAEESGVHFVGKNYGTAVADFDRDGWDDIFAICVGEPCKLFRNNGNGTFTDVAPELGLDYIGTPACAGWVDVDNNGWLDLLITNRDEHNKFFLSDGDGTFTENTFLSGLMIGTKVRALLFSDINMDGNIDIYLARINMENIMYLNIGDGKFLNYTNQSGALDNQISMGAIFFDYDNDSDPDLYLTHDANQPFILYENDGAGHFTDVSEQSGTDVAAMGMGVDFADVNNDGWLDIYVTNLYPNSLLLNNGDGTFTEIGSAAGVDDIGMGWGCGFFDFDNDGWQDIYIANDSYFAPIPNVLYRNNRNNTFDAVSEGTPLECLEPSYGFAFSDFDNDGLVDIYLANYSGSAGNQLFKNENYNQNNWLKIKAEGTESNRAAIGTRVSIEAGGQLLTDEITGTSGYASQNSFTLHFGLGAVELVEKLTIRWPNGMVEVYENLPVNTIYSFIEGNGFITPAKEIYQKRDPSVSIYPNPAVNTASIKMDSDRSLQLKGGVFNNLGLLIHQFEFYHPGNGEQVFPLETANLSSGIYYLKLNGPDFSATSRFLIIGGE